MFNTLAGLVAVLWQSIAFGGTMMPASAGPPLPNTQAVCSAVTGAQGTCLAKVRSDKNGVKPYATYKALPAGYSPQQLRSAYGVNVAGSGSIAVITAYDNPNIKRDLDNYDSTFGVASIPNCSTAGQTACFSKINQNGSSSSFFLPRPNRGWALETDLDVQMAHAVCPGCRLTLVEANSSYLTDLTTAVDRAVAVGAKVVSMSWGAGEFSGETSYDSHFNVPGVEFVAASGDGGFSTSWPSSNANVVSAGGTHLVLDSSGNRSSESVWSGSGSGCSLFETKPAWQTDKATCSNRTENDAAADADPYTGAAIYSSYSSYGTGWFIVGGTSLSTPLLAGMIADAGATTQTAFFGQLYSSLGSSSLYDVNSGADGSCSPAYLCTARAGYDGPSGVGSPNGLGAF